MALFVANYSLNQKDKDASWLGMSFPVAGLLNIWPSLMVNHKVLAYALLVNFSISVAWWPTYVYYSCKYNSWNGLKTYGFLLLLWYVIGYHSYNTIKMESSIKSCMYEKFPLPSEECWEFDTYWTGPGKWVHKYPSNKCNKYTADICSSFWFGIIGGFGSIYPAIKRHEFVECFDKNGYSMAGFTENYILMFIWLIFYLVLLSIYLPRIPKFIKGYMIDEPIANVDVLVGRRSTTTQERIDMLYVGSQILLNLNHVDKYMTPSPKSQGSYPHLIDNEPPTYSEV